MRSPPVTLLPLQRAQQAHIGLLQAVYRAAPRYWAYFDLPGAPPGLAERDLAAAESIPGRSIIGILASLAPDNPTGGIGMVGMVDIRLHYPDAGVATLGLIMVAEPYQRQGMARAAWRALAPWLGGQAGMQRVRAGVEQFNTPALGFFQAIGFRLTGEALRQQVGERLVRLLYLEHELGSVQ